MDNLSQSTNIVYDQHPLNLQHQSSSDLPTGIVMHTDEHKDIAPMDIQYTMGDDDTNIKDRGNRAPTTPALNLFQPTKTHAPTPPPDKVNVELCSPALRSPTQPISSPSNT